MCVRNRTKFKCDWFCSGNARNEIYVTVIHGAQVLDSLSKNCGNKIFQEISDADILQDLISVINKKVLNCACFFLSFSFHMSLLLDKVMFSARLASPGKGTEFDWYLARGTRGACRKIPSVLRCIPATCGTCKTFLYYDLANSVLVFSSLILWVLDPLRWFLFQAWIIFTDLSHRGHCLRRVLF